MGIIKFLNHRIKSFKYAIRGLKWVIQTQGNFQFHLLALIIVINAGIFFSLTGYEWLAIVVCSTLVLVSEVFNSAIEELVNFISPQFNAKAVLIKDIAAAAVLLSAIGAVVCGLIIFLPKLIDCIGLFIF